MTTAADVKQLLKDAREAINKIDFSKAQELCRTILKSDKDNYMALVMLGVSLQESEEAVKPFLRAISLDSKKLLAWQGLASHYEKVDQQDVKIKLLKIYEQILKLETDENKSIQLITKVSGLGIEISEIVQFLYKYASNVDSDNLKTTIRSILLDMLRNKDILASKDPVMVVFSELIVKHSDDQILISNYSRLLYRNSKFVFDNSHSMSTVSLVDPGDLTLHEWFCSETAHAYFEHDCLPEHDFKKYIAFLNENNICTLSSDLLKAIFMYEYGDVLEAFTLACQLKGKKELIMYVLIVLVECSLKMCNWQNVELLVIQNLSSTLPEFKIKLIRALILSYSNQGKHEKAIKLGEQIEQDLNTAEQVAMALSYLHLNDMEQVNKYIKLLEKQGTHFNDILEAIVFLKNNNIEKAKLKLETSQNDSYLKWLNLGLIYWKLKDFDRSLVPFLNAVRRQPYDYKSFLYLGHYYSKHANNIQKSSRCYEMAFNLNNSCLEAAKSLSQLYIQLGDQKSNFKLLKEITEKDNQETWPKFQLGLHFLKLRQWDDAVLNFQSVIRIENSNPEGWECLGDAYYSRGSYTSALKCYQRVMEIPNGNHTYAQIRIGAVNFVLQQYTEALNAYNKIPLNNSCSVITFKGLAETWLAIAKKNFQLNLYGLARDCAQKSINFISDALKLQQKYCSLWKILSDGLVLISRLPKKYSNVFIKECFIGQKEEKLVFLKDTELFPVITAGYCRALDLSPPSNTTILHALSLAYLEYYKATKDNSVCNKAFVVAKHCLKMRPNCWRNWNLLGVIAVTNGIKQYNLALHCFLKSIKIRKVNTMAWTNLGFMYLMFDRVRAANRCFTKGQNSDPYNMRCWIGQALIAEEWVAHEAMDLFRHASVLGYHRESIFGYAYWVCKTLQESKNLDDPHYQYAIVNMNAIPVSLDKVIWLSDNEPSNSCILTLRGILEERMGLPNSALKSYKNALDNVDPCYKDIAHLNYGRILLRLGLYEDAVKTFKAIPKFTIDSACGLALALFATQKFEESYSIYETALLQLTDDLTEKVDLLVAMAGIAYSFGGIDDAKTLLFQSIRLTSSPSIHSILAACSLGILHSDKSLSMLALQEVKKFEGDSNYTYDIEFVRSQFYSKHNNLLEGQRSLSRSIHISPSTSKLWYCLASHCMQDFNMKPVSARICLVKAICHGKGNMDITNILALTSICELVLGNLNSALSFAQKAVHNNPDKSGNWAVLISALLQMVGDTHDRVSWIKNTVSFMTNSMHCNKGLSIWLQTVQSSLEVYHQ